MRGRANQTPATAFAINSTQGVVQGYFAVNSGDLGYAVPQGTSFESQQKVDGIATRIEKTVDAAGDTDTQISEYDGAQFQNQGGPVNSGGVPNLNVSTQGELAIENTTAEARNYFASPNALAASNTKLREVGSEVRLAPTGQTISVPTNPDPANYDATPKQLDKVQVDPNIDGNGDLDNFFASYECNNFVQNIIGSAERVAVLGRGANQVEVDAPSENEPVNVIADYVSSTGPAHQHPQNLANDIQANQPGPNAQSDYNAMNKNDVDASLGINAHALPEIGEGYVVKPLKDDIDQERLSQEQTANKFHNVGGHNDEYLQALNDLNATNQLLDVKTQGLNAKAMSLKHLWIYHYAGVIAKDGGDTITLENYNRAQEKRWIISDAFNRLFLAQQDFRDFVWQSTTDLKAQDFARQRQLINNMQARGALLNGAFQGLYDTAHGIVEAHIGPMRSMIHFKMYGSEAGQSFHEKWQPSTANQVTLRIRQSLDQTKNQKVNAAQNNSNQLQAALNQVCPNVVVANRLTLTANNLQNDIALCIVDIQNAGTIEAVNQACSQVNTLKDALDVELGLCLEILLPTVQAQSPLPNLIQQLATEIGNNAIGYRIQGRDDARNLKRSLQALHASAVAINQVRDL